MKVPLSALVLQLHRLPELRTQEGGSCGVRGALVKMIYKSRMCSG